MATKTMAQLITDVERTLYQSAGPQVQVYSQDIIMQMVQDAYTHIVCGKTWWPNTIKREMRTLNGTTGEITTDLTYIADYNDIRGVFRPGSDRPLSGLPVMTNTSYLTGATPQYTEATGAVGKLFRVWPLASTGTIEIIGRQTASTFRFDDVVPFDDLVLRHQI